MTFKITTPKGAFELMQNGAIYLDVRTEGEFSGGHPKGAVNIPFIIFTDGGKEKNQNFVTDVQKQFKRDAKLVLGCAVGGRSAAACQVLLDVGFTNLTNCDGSWNGTPSVPGWKDEGLPCE